jgi:hypothetical protein
MFKFGVIYYIYLVDKIHMCVNKHELQTKKKVCTHVKYYTFLLKTGPFSLSWTFLSKMFKFGVIYHIYLVKLIHICVEKHELQTKKKLCTHVKYYTIIKLDIFTHTTGLFFHRLEISAQNIRIRYNLSLISS